MKSACRAAVGQGQLATVNVPLCSIMYGSVSSVLAAGAGARQRLPKKVDRVEKRKYGAYLVVVEVR